MTEQSRFCQKCQQSKPASQWYASPTNQWGCKECVARYQRHHSKQRDRDNLSPDERKIAGQNFTDEATDRERGILERCAWFVSQCRVAWCAVHVITHEWCVRGHA